MKAIFIIGIGVVALGIGAYGYSLIQKAKSKEKKKINLPTEFVKILNVKDIVQFFRSQGLDKEVDAPFMACNASELTDSIELPENIEDKSIIILGVWDKKKDEVKAPLKLVIATTLGEDIKELMGKDKFVLLS